MDSPSNLFSRLDLAENLTSPRQKHMDDMDTDLVEEDTAPSFNPRTGPRRKNRNNHHWRGSGPRPSGGSNADTEQQRRRARLVQLINDTLETESSSQNQDEVLQCEQNRVSDEATVNGEPFEKSHPYHPRHKGWWRKKEKGQIPVFDGGDSALRPRDKWEKREGIVLSDNSFRHSGSWRKQGQRRWAHKGYIAPCYSAKNRISTEADGQGTGDFVGGATRSSFAKNNNKNKMKGADSPCVSQPKIGEEHQRWSLPKNSGPGRLAQNGCPSHCKMAQDRNVANSYGLGTMVQRELLDENSPHQHIVRPDSEGRHPDKRKGKMILDDNILSGGQISKAEFHSDRLCSIEETEVAGISNDDNAFRSSDDIPWRRHDVTSKAHALPPEQSVCVSKREQGTSGHLSNLKHKIPMEYREYVRHVNDSPEIKGSHWSNPKAVLAQKESESGSRGNQRRQKFMKGKRKCNFICSNFGGSSSSTFENLETFDLQSTRHNPYTRSTMTCHSQHHDDIYDPVMELDELQSPALRRNNLQELSTRVPNHSSARVSQVESDEMLARQLQEQFYDEVVGSAGTEEIDATIAWSLQREDAQQAASAARRFQSDNREASMAHLYAYYTELPYRSSSARWLDRAHSQTLNGRNYYSSEIDLETRLVAEARNFMGMDLQTRRNFLEELEAAFDHNNDTLGSHHDFNENDYEMLLALDENIHQPVGASESQINSLPQSVIQSDTVEETCSICLENPSTGDAIRHLPCLHKFHKECIETCSICLENPSTGDAIRHLPCLHKFHKECIDTWLRRRAWCPVCKSTIT